MELVSFAFFAFKCGAYLVWKIKEQQILNEVKDGKLPEGKFRELILSGVNLINLKLDSQARTDLNTSISMYKEGLENLNAVLNNIKKAPGKDNMHTAAAATTTECIDQKLMFSPKLDFVDVVTESYEGLKVADLDKTDKDIFEIARKAFEKAATMAAKAFNTGVLTTPERIQGMSIRIMARILEIIENPAAALPSCQSFLKELHSLSDVQAIFRLAVTNTGKKSPLNNEEKMRIFVGVCHLNRIVFDVMQLVRKNQGPWTFPPIIAEDGKVVHRIDPLRDVRVAEALSLLLQKKKETMLLSVTDFPVSWSFAGTETTKLISPRDIVRNKQGQFIVADNGDRCIKVFDQSGKYMKPFFPLPLYLADEDIFAVATDHEDNIFVLILIDKFHFKVFSFDKHGQLLKKFPLREGIVHGSPVINESSEFLVLLEEKDTKRSAVEVYKTDGEFIKSFGQNILKEPKDMTLANGGHCMVLNSNGHVSVFDAEGNHLSKRDFDHAHDAPAEAIAFHPESDHVVISNSKPEFRVNISTYNERRDCEHNIFQGGEQKSKKEQRKCVPPKIAVTKNGNIAILAGFVGECKVIVV